MLAFVVCHFILFGALTILYFVYIGAFFFHLAGRLDLNREYTWIFLIPTLPFLGLTIFIYFDWIDLLKLQFLKL